MNRYKNTIHIRALLQTKKRIKKNWRRHPDLNWGVKVLQTSALPLGYVALTGAENEIRTRDPLLGKEVLYH